MLNPAEILRSPRFKEFLHEVREHYDVIIVDAPPVLPVADAFEVAPEVDGVILVYEVGRIGRGILHRAKVQLENVNSNVLGVILNNVKPDVAPDFYRYRTDYYYEQKNDWEAATPLGRWKEAFSQGIGGIRSILSKKRPASATEGKGLNLLMGKGLNLLILSVLTGLVLIGGLLWFKPSNPSPPAKKSQSQRAKIVAPASDSKASTGLPREISKAARVAKMPTVSRSELDQAQKKPLSIAKRSVEKTQLLEPNSILANKPSQIISLQLSEAQTWESLPQTAEIRLGPGFHTPILYLIRRGTQLQVVGRNGDWLKLELRNGSTGWIYHSLAQPEREHVRKPHTVVKESKETSEPIVTQPNMIKKASSAEEARSPRQKGAETYVSLPNVAKIRSEPGIHAPVLQLIQKGTRLQVVGRNGYWLKLQLRNGSTGWIYHSLAQPERELIETPQTVLRGSKVITESFSVKTNVMQHSSFAEEFFSSMQNGSEVALVYPD